jgi:DNA-binding transcriptional LysR family regulator
MHSSAQIEAISAGSIDIGILRERPESAELTHALLLREHFVAILPKHHALVRRKAIAPDALTQQPLVLFARSAAPSMHDQIGALLGRQPGFRPEHEANEWHTIAALVSAGLGVSLAPASVARLRIAGVKYVPLKSSVVTMLWVAWRRDAAPTVQRFAEFVTSA